MKLEAEPAPVPGGAIDLGPFNRGVGLPDTHLLAVLREETQARLLSGASAPRFPACAEKGSRLTFWHLPTNNSRVVPQGFSLISQHLEE